jgi:WD40 repeat protein
MEAGTGRALQKVQGLSGPVSVLSPDGLLRASGGSDNGVQLRLAASPSRVLHELRGHKAPVQSMAFSPDGRTLATGGGDSTVRLWDIATGRELRRLQGNLSPVWSVAFRPDGRVLASAGSDMLVHLWESATGRELRRLEAHEGIVNCLRGWAPAGLGWG